MKKQVLPFISKHKARLLLLAMTSVISGQIYAQALPVDAPFEKGSGFGAVSLGFGANYSYVHSGSTTPTFAVSYDHGIIEAGPGTIGIGGVIGFRSTTYKYAGDKATFTNTLIGARGSYHLSLLKDKDNKFDPYAGITLGMRLYRYKDSYSGDKFSSSELMAGLFVGARYHFSKNLGAFAELGYDISLLRLGLTFKFS